MGCAPTVPGMRYFHHSPFAFWVAAAAALSTLLLAAVHVGEQVEPAATPPPRSVSTDVVLALHSRVPTLLILADAPDARLASWADTTAELAHRGARQRADDPLGVALTDVADAADVLAATSPDDLAAVDAAVADVLTALDQLTSAWSATGLVGPDVAPSSPTADVSNEETDR